MLGSATVCGLNMLIIIAIVQLPYSLIDDGCLESPAHTSDPYYAQLVPLFYILFAGST